MILEMLSSLLCIYLVSELRLASGLSGCFLSVKLFLYVIIYVFNTNSGTNMWPLVSYSELVLKKLNIIKNVSFWFSQYVIMYTCNM